MTKGTRRTERHTFKNRGEGHCIYYVQVWEWLTLRRNSLKVLYRLQKQGGSPERTKTPKNVNIFIYLGMLKGLMSLKYREQCWAWGQWYYYFKTCYFLENYRIAAFLDINCGIRNNSKAVYQPWNPPEWWMWVSTGAGVGRLGMSHRNGWMQERQMVAHFCFTWEVVILCR